ncbi:MAG TPA: hypothetical protein VFG30_29610 [Polyangiales bacterium]|nr:hypothetical protein [Polyangiales bacterium]
MKRSFAYLFAVAITVIATSSCGDDETPADAGPDSGKASTCGNGKVEGAELCDGDNLNHETCATVGDGIYSKGTLLCSKKCVFDISMCFGEDSGMSDMDDGGGGGGGTGG